MSKGWQINRWVKWFNQKEIHRLQPKKSKHKDKKTLLTDLFQTIIQQEIKKLTHLKTKKNWPLYLKIINKYQTKVSFNNLCRWLGIAKNTYYRWLQKQNQPLFSTPLEIKIKKICEKNKYYNNIGENFFIWGYRKVHQELLIHQMKTNPKTVYYKMKKFSFLCQTLKNKYDRKRTYLNRYLPVSQLNLLKNNFQTFRSLQKLCTDITYLFFQNNQKIYLSVLMDLYNREIINYNFSKTQNINFVLKTLATLPVLSQTGIIHSDQGSVYTSKEFHQITKEKKLITSFSEAGQPSQNACLESFFANLKCETIYLEKKKILTKKRLMNIVHTFIQNYNQTRKIKYLNYLSPYQFV